MVAIMCIALTWLGWHVLVWACSLTSRRAVRIVDAVLDVVAVSVMGVAGALALWLMVGGNLR